jgi:hypothetical protein
MTPFTKRVAARDTSPVRLHPERIASCIQRDADPPKDLRYWLEIALAAAGFVAILWIVFGLGGGR